VKHRLTPRRAAAATLIVAVAIQLVPVERANPPVEFEVDPPADVHAILKRSCYDCHSNETRWPWYSRVAPASWLVARDVRRGREDLNFSEWPAFDFEDQEVALSDIVKQIDKGKMPLPVYLVMHPGARLSESERGRLLEWARVE
jgi:hypothetical protein